MVFPVRRPAGHLVAFDVDAARFQRLLEVAVDADLGVGREVVYAQDRHDVVVAGETRWPLDARGFEKRDLPQSRDVLASEFGKHPRRLVHRRHLRIGRPLEDVSELQTGAAADIEDADTLVGGRDLCRRGAVERRAICGELGVPQVGDVVEEVGQALDIVADAAGIPGDPSRLPQALELRIERLLVTFQRHTFSVAAPVARR